MVAATLRLKFLKSWACTSGAYANADDVIEVDRELGLKLIAAGTASGTTEPVGRAPVTGKACWRCGGTGMPEDADRCEYCFIPI